MENQKQQVSCYGCGTDYIIISEEENIEYCPFCGAEAYESDIDEWEPQDEDEYE